MQCTVQVPKDGNARGHVSMSIDVDADVHAKNEVGKTGRAGKYY